jgi:microcystin-dependent protein
VGYIPEITGDRIKDGTLQLVDLAPGVAGFGSVPGVIVPFSGTVAPNGWLFCHGQLVSTTTYATLFAVAGHTYNGGVDPGGNSFRLPDLRGRAVFGKDDMGGTAASRMTLKTLGGSGGVESAVLTLNEMPPHSHGGTTENQSTNHSHSGSTGNDNVDHGHTTGVAHGNNLYRLNGTSPTGEIVSMRPDLYGANITSGSGGRSALHQHSVTIGNNSANHTHSFTTGNPTGQGTQTALSRMPPHLILNWIISTGEAYVAPVNVAEMIPRSVLTAKGNIIVATATNAEGAIAPPSLNQVLLGDPSTATGWKLHSGPLPNLVEWTNVTPVNGYTQYASPYGTTSFMKDAMGTVFVRGLLQVPASPNVTMFTLPVGCRPGRELILRLANSSAAGSGEIRIMTTGVVLVNASGASNGGWQSCTFDFKAEG